MEGLNLNENRTLDRIKDPELKEAVEEIIRDTIEALKNAEDRRAIIQIQTESLQRLSEVMGTPGLGDGQTEIKRFNKLEGLITRLCSEKMKSLIFPST